MLEGETGWYTIDVTEALRSARELAAGPSIAIRFRTDSIGDWGDFNGGMWHQVEIDSLEEGRMNPYLFYALCNDVDCDNGILCDGVEVCIGGTCQRVKLMTYPFIP